MAVFFALSVVVYPMTPRAEMEALEKKGLISPESVKKYQKEISDKKKASAEAEIKKVKENTAPSQNPKKDKAVKKFGNNNRYRKLQKI